MTWNKNEPWNKNKPWNEDCTQAADTKREQDFDFDGFADELAKEFAPGKKLLEIANERMRNKTN